MNYSGKLNLLKLKNTKAVKIKGRTATKSCVVIPIEDNSLYVGEKGIYLDLMIREVSAEKRVSGDSHIMSQNFSKEVYDKMTDDEKKQQPILGSMKEFQAAKLEVTAVAEVVNEDDLPF